MRSGGLEPPALRCSGFADGFEKLDASAQIDDGHACGGYCCESGRFEAWRCNDVGPTLEIVKVPEEHRTIVHGSRLFRILQALERSPAVSYILDSGRRIVHCNPAWNNFAIKNGAPQLTAEGVIGLDIFKVIPDVLKNFYCNVVARALAQGVWEVSYECSSPDLFRKYRMRVHDLKEKSWLLVTNSLIYEGPHRRMAKPRSNLYVQANGLITMCAHCRCSRRVDLPEQWDFVPDYLRLKGQASLILSHGFCPICHAYFYT